MPSNKKEGIIFGIFMVIGMLTIMLSYNVFVLGTIEMTVGKFIITYLGTFIFVFIIESIVTGPATKVALSLPYDKSNKVKVIIAIATVMVPTMVLIMSAYGVTMIHFTTGIEGPIWKAYLTAVGLNIIVALPAQLLIVGPISRRLLQKYVQKKPQQLNTQGKIITK